MPAFSACSKRSFRRAGLRRSGAEMRYGAGGCSRFGVRPPSPGLRADGLSGGNQQKLLLGRELDRKPTVIVAHSPTQGLDIAATAAAHNALIEAAAHRAAVIVISPDLDELIAIADRIVVLSAGQDRRRIGPATSSLSMQRGSVVPWRSVSFTNMPFE